MFKNKVDTYFRRADYAYIKNVGLSIRQWLPCPLAIWEFALDGKWTWLIFFTYIDDYVQVNTM